MSFKPAIPTMSLGHGAAGYTMREKLEAAAAAGFTGIEGRLQSTLLAATADRAHLQVFYMCLEAFSLELPGETPRDKLREAARQTKAIANGLGLTIFVLQPILNYDGIVDPKEHAERVEELVFRFELCKLLGTDMMQIPANFRLDDGVTGDVAKVVADIQEIADLGALESPRIRFVYEAMLWSTTNYTWQQGWNIVKLVDRPNVGAVLDAFHIAGFEYADPTTPGGVRPDGAERLTKSLEELVKTVPGDRIFYIQLVDAERLDVPLAKLGSEEGSLSPYHVKGQQPGMSWSRNCRLFPYETERGAYLPVEQVCKAFVETGFQGWVSFELFNRFMSVPNARIPSEHAERGWKSWKTLEKNLGL